MATEGATATLVVARVAVSTRRLLVARWLIVLAIVCGFVLQNVAPMWTVRALGIVLIVGHFGLQRGWGRSLWIERGADAVAIRRRRLLDLLLRRPGAVVERFGPDIEVRYDARTPTWWRCDHALWVDGRRYVVYPDGRSEAQALAHR